MLPGENTALKMSLVGILVAKENKYRCEIHFSDSDMNTLVWLLWIISGNS